MRRTFSEPRAAGAVLAGFILLCAGVAPAAAEIGEASVQREGDALRLRWTASGPVDVYVADVPDAPAAGRHLLSRADVDGQERVAADPARRHYYLLVEADDSRWLAERVLPLAGASNFRDLGGYETRDGRHVKWGKLYRSATMNNLTAGDYEYLSSLGIKVLCDLRSTQERELAPTTWKAEPGARYMAVDYDGDAMFARLTQRDAKTSMPDFYAEAPLRFREQYRRMFQSLVSGEAPLSVNCSAGQDRTGVAAALILTALGVPRATIYQDYLLSTELRRPENEVPSVDLDKVKDDGATAHFWWQRYQAARQDPDVLKPKPLVREDGQPALATTFETLEQKYGSVDAYLQQVLAIGPADIARLRALYLD